MDKEIFQLKEEVERIRESIAGIEARLDAIQERINGLEPGQSDESEESYRSEPSRQRLRTAFTINDCYRFRRELFGNSAADFADAVDLLSAMNSIEEVEDYLFNDLGWEQGGEHVDAFMAIVRRCFSDRPANIL